STASSGGVAEDSSSATASSASGVSDTRPTGTTGTAGAVSVSGLTTGSTKPVRQPTTPVTDLDWTAPAPATVGMVRELEAQLKLALQAFERSDRLFQRGVISSEEREQTRGKVLLASAVLQGLDDDLADELDRLKVEMKKKTAELHQAQAQEEVATNVVK